MFISWSVWHMMQVTLTPDFCAFLCFSLNFLKSLACSCVIWSSQFGLDLDGERDKIRFIILFQWLLFSSKAVHQKVNIVLTFFGDCVLKCNLERSDTIGKFYLCCWYNWYCRGNFDGRGFNPDSLCRCCGWRWHSFCCLLTYVKLI